MSDVPTPTGYQRSAGGGFKWLPPSAEHLSKLLPQYEVECLLGRGGMGAVYKGRQRSLNRPVAIKILPQGLEDEDASYTERFKNEAQILARLSHPCIVAVHDFGETSEGQLYIVMEFVNGTDVAQMITSQGRLPPEHALAVAAHVCDALSYAHKNGVIHRDIKPANILINHEGAVKVADFGLAKVDEPGTSGLTKTGMAMGTPDYVAPEALIMGTQIDGRADLYAIGVMLYHMLTGEVPRGAFDLPSRRFGTDPRFDAIILKAMKMDREERYQSSGEIRHDLDVILSVPLVQTGGTSSAAIPQRNTNFPVREEAAPNLKSPISNPKSNKTMITLAATAAVLATGAFLVLKPDVARNSDSENAPQPQNWVSENRATPAAKQSGPLSPLSGPANDAKTTAQGTERTTLPAAPPAKPILVAQANTTPKALQLGQSAPSADPVPARKPDPAKWAKITSVSQFVRHGGLEEVDGGWHLTKGYANLKSEAKDYAIRALVSAPGKMGITMSLRMVSSGLAYRADLANNQVLIYKSRPVATPFDGRSKLEKLASFDADTKGVYGQGDTFTFSVAGNVLTVWLGNKELGSVTDNEFAEGQLAIGATDATFRDIEYQVLDGTSSSVAVAQAPTTPPATPPVATLPPELTTLQQQYDKLLVERVTGIYDAEVAKLNAGYLAGLDRAAATAQSAGELDTVLAIQEEKKLIAAKQPVPTTDDAKTPEPLKNLRTIFRTSLAKLDEQRTANHTALLTPYATRLKQIEADLTKAGRIPDAVAVKQYRESLGTNPVPAAVAQAPTAPPTPTTPVTSDDPKLPKADERQAAEWVLGIGGSIFIKEGAKPSYTLNSKAGLPKGKFQILDFKLDGKTTTGPVNAESLKVLAGLKDLTSFWMDNIELADEELSFIGTFPNLIKLEISHNSKFTGSAVKHLAKLRSLTEFTTFSTAFNDEAVALLVDCKGLTRVMLGGNSNITNSCIPHLDKLSKLQSLSVSVTQVTPEGLAQLQTKLATLGMNLVSGESIQPVVTAIAPKQPQLSRVILSHRIPDDTLTVLKAFPKLTVIDMAGAANESLLDGLGDLPDLVEFIAGVPFKLTDAGLMKFVPSKKLKKLTIKSTAVTDAGIAAFKKVRPDVTVTR